MKWKNGRFVPVAKEETMLGGMNNSLIKLDDALERKWMWVKLGNEKLEGIIHCTDYDRSEKTGECGIFW
jgi:hypothetical protein